MTEETRVVGEYVVRPAEPADVEGARTLMLDTFYRVLGHGYVPRWHADVIDIEGTYFRTPGHALFVAVRGERVVGTASVRADGPKSPPHPAWIAERYPSGPTAQIFRTYVDPEHRRQGLATELVRSACSFIASVPGYESIYLHTNPAIDGAEPFWRAIAKEVHDARRDPGHSSTVHFEIPITGIR
ncbi:Acetyltransferase (GNAT) family protein [Actinopolyspora lacussalsi subsp. righensis]|uniref:Acetyltransferase (GNAT) family protein n=1 Tax=Actinopolyspora righensis TaxID=995060 RepID=A0A1I6YX89_9ACTN|nr:GNAT family N-acetyltransferase [Actinopolyspora righensis]SFT55123.1 Acetyltransferase (GNAT) family protein [Actinopolyspora righensis]